MNLETYNFFITTTLELGDRVAIEPGVPCSSCNYCKNGRYNLCHRMVFCATPPHDGNLARYYSHAADFCYKLPDHMSMEEGALLEPLAVAVHSCRRAGITIGQKILICGAGPIGLVCLLTAKAMGASSVVITGNTRSKRNKFEGFKTLFIFLDVIDICENRLEMAKSLGADHTLLVGNELPETLATKVVEALGEKADAAIECSGAESSIRLAVFVIKR